MATANRSKGVAGASVGLKPIRLTSHDINVVSVIAQKTALPHEILIQYAKSSKVSSDALKVITYLLESHGGDHVLKKISGKKTPAKVVATDFSKWAAKLK